MWTSPPTAQGKRGLDQPLLNLSQPRPGTKLSVAATPADGRVTTSSSTPPEPREDWEHGVDRHRDPDGGRKAFVNFTRQALLGGYASALPSNLLVVEILEDVPADPDVLKACRALKAGGCAIALDDIVTTAPPRGFLGLADIVKVDFAKTSAFRRHQIARALRRPGTKMLAEKVETQEDFNQALHSGYEYFQGYFFARPSIVAGRAIPASKLNILNLISEVHRPDLVHAHVENIIKHEVSLTLKLLTLSARRPGDSAVPSNRSSTPFSSSGTRA
jgi:c-di-GMP-related signal transduction protein